MRIEFDYPTKKDGTFSLFPSIEYIWGAKRKGGTVNFLAIGIWFWYICILIKAKKDDLYNNRTE